ncbi:hypothetical protein CNECB9_2370147 [Cupriavidus necator]|uniref:Uncharacterized protein n=1 Tax=Cupriavidus necator TaxID=106590 RepID=A0A1K0IEG2_CUPNE|nr:hypothetical protein CNECB9_2370147 [Cupriavidus necator]
MNLTRLTFTLDGHAISVTGYYDRGYAGNRWEPPEPESFSISTAEITEQADPNEPVSIDDLDEEDLAVAALRAWHERDEGEREHYASMRREEMRLGARL